MCVFCFFVSLFFVSVFLCLCVGEQVLISFRVSVFLFDCVVEYMSMIICTSVGKGD